MAKELTGYIAVAGINLMNILQFITTAINTKKEIKY